MAIALTDKIVALLVSLTDDQIDQLPPVERRRLEDACLRVMVLCAPVPRQEPKQGVLFDLRDRGEEWR